MLLQEFEYLTGFYPTGDLYAVIEEAYLEFKGDKTDFCSAYMENRDGLAERIRKRAELKRIADERSHKNCVSKLEEEIKNLHRQLECELEWRSFEDEHNVAQADYEKLAAYAASGNGSTHFMSDEEAKDWLYSEYGFAREKVIIIHEVDAEEINRHMQIRKTGVKRNRRPVYDATDYHYIRFNTARWKYEVWNGMLRPFYD